MNNKYMQFLTGHQKFMIRQSWLIKGINAISEGEDIYSNKKLIESIDYLGIGSNMVQSLRYWMKAFGLVNSDYSLTEDCKELYKLDPFLSDGFTKWILHIWNTENSPIWQMIFVQDKLTNFDTSYLLERLKQHINSNGRSIKQKTIQDLINVFIALYCKRTENDPEKIIISPLENLMIMKQKSSEEYQITNKDLNQISPAIVLYLIANKNDKEQLTIHEVSELIKRYINMDFLSIRKIIDQLALKKHVVFDKSTGLDNVTISNKEKKSLSFCWDYYHGK